jgi:uncharacterized protein (TIGR03067 family)
MKVQVVLVLVVGLLVGADKNEDKVKKELEKFQGEWVPVLAEINGTAVPYEGLKVVKVTVKGDQVTMKEGDQTAQATITLDPTEKPRRIDSTSKYSKGKEIKTTGIYEFDGGKLKVCYTLAGGQRPKEFSTKGGTEGNPVFLIVYQRAKEDK